MIMEGRKENSQVIPPEAGAWLVCGPAGQRLHRPRAGRCARDPSKRRRRSRAAAGLGVGVHETGLSSTLTENI
mgnify:CR=1 FL=1